MLSAQQKGRLFETEVHEFLQRTNPEVLMTEKEIRNIDNTITAIDHLLISNDIYYCFQDKWLSSNISNSDFNHFTKCVEKISTIINSENDINCKVYAIYLSNTDFSSIALKQLNEENEKYNLGLSNIEYIKINHFYKNTLLLKLHTFLHSNNLYVYDINGDCMMI